MQKFELHPRLKADTVKVSRLKLCQLFLMNDACYPWLILVPARPDITEIHHLHPCDQQQLIHEISKTSAVMDDLFNPDKINVGALGCIVPQLHVHIVARYKTDPAWPGPVWGATTPRPYTEDALKKRIKSLVGRMV